jgi:hypothetical protein
VYVERILANLVGGSLLCGICHTLDGSDDNSSNEAPPPSYPRLPPVAAALAALSALSLGLGYEAESHLCKVIVKSKNST